MKWLIIALSLLTTGCSGAFAGATPFGGNPIFLSAPFVEHCESCHATDSKGGAPNLFAKEWKQTIGLDGGHMGWVLDRYLAPSHPPHGLSVEDTRTIRQAIVCHHYPRSAACRTE